MITAELRNTKDFTRITAKVEANLQDHMIEQSRLTAEDVVSYIRRNWSPSVPSSAGAPPAQRSFVLGDGIEVEKQGRISGRFGGTFESVTLIVFDTSENKRGQYAAAVEKGHNSPKTGTVAPRPFIEPAFEKHTDKYVDNIKKWKVKT
jgi:hypothetical protein